MIKNKGKLIYTLIASLLFATNVNASCTVSVGGAEDSGYGYQTQKQTCTTSKGNNIDIYCIDKGYHNVSDLSQCTFKEVTGTGYSNIYNMGGFSKKELAYRYYSYKNGIAKTAIGEVAPKIKNGSIVPAEIKNVVDKLSPNLNSSSTNGIFSETHTIDGGVAKVTITVNVPGLTIKDFSVDNGAKITGVINSGQKTLVNITKSIETCKGANFNLNLKSTSTSSSNVTRLFIAQCPGVQNYVVEIPVGIPVEEVISTTTTDSYTVSIPDPSCNCSGETNLEGACEANNNTKQYFVKDSEDIKTCIISGNYQKYCNNDIQKTNDNNSYSNKTNITNKYGNTDVNLSSTNNYCKVYCTEDVSYDFPGIINVGSGQYFKLKNDDTDKPLTITGKRTCYTDKINKNQYIEDVTSIQRSIESKYNEYLENKAKAESAKNARQEAVSCNGTCTAKNGTKNLNGTNGERYVPENVNYMEASVVIKSNGSVSVNFKSTSTVAAIWGDTCSCNGSCPTGQTGTFCNLVDDKTTRQDKVNEYTAKANAALDEAKQLLEDLKTAINNYKSCYEWNNNYCFNPKVEFSYDEVYDMTGNLSSTISNGTIEEKFITGEIDEKYNGNANSSYNTQKLEYLYIDGENLITQTSDINITANYVSKSVTKVATFADSTKEVYSYHPYGTISTEYNCGVSEDKKGNCKKLGYVLPVALEHQNSTASYNYYLDITNIGTSGDDTTCDLENIGNRLMGNECSVYKQETTGNVGEKEYTCQYKTCPECEIECVCPENSPNCYVEDNVCKYVTCPTCTISCIGCLWNNGNSTFAYKQVSLSDVFPNSESNTDVGYNWNTDSNVNPQADKAEKTLEEIEEDGEEAYAKPEYSYTLTPATMAKIRQYNEAANGDTKKKLDNFGDVDTGGYNNDTLQCTDGKECKSTFLNGLDKIVGENNRIRNDKWTTYANGSAWK